MRLSDDRLLRAFDRFVEAVYWSEDDITFADALGEAIDDWVALAAAEFNESAPIDAASPGDGLGSSLAALTAATQLLRRERQPEMTIESALAVSLADWCQVNAHSPETASAT